ncbi:MAG: histidine kinase [Spirosomataceae bacterium]
MKALTVFFIFDVYFLAAQTRNNLPFDIEKLDSLEVVYTLAGNKVELAKIKSQKGLFFLEMGNLNRDVSEGASMRLLKESAELFLSEKDSTNYYITDVRIIHFNAGWQMYAPTTTSRLIKAAAYFERTKHWTELIDTYALLLESAVALHQFSTAVENGQASEVLIKTYFTKATPEDTLNKARLYHYLTYLYLELYQKHTKSEEYLRKSQYYIDECRKNFTEKASIYGWIYPLNGYALGLIAEFKGNYKKAIEYYAQFEFAIPPYNKFGRIKLNYHFQYCHYQLKNYALAQAYVLKNKALTDSVEIAKNRYVMDYGISGHDLSGRDVESLLTNERTENARIVAENRTQWLWIILIFLGSLMIYLIQQQVYRNKQNKLALEAAVINLQKENTVKLLEVQEQERQYIARELHDSLGGMLAIAKLNAENVQAMFSAENMHHLIGLLNESQNELRQIIDHFQMPTFGHIQLTEMMSDWIAKLQQWNPGIQFYFHCSGREGGSELIRQQLFRVAQELVYNAVKHANSSAIRLELNFFEDNAILLVQDNGVGFSLTNPREGRGMVNVNSRLQLLNGYIEFFPNTPTGTCVLVHTPLIN